MGNFHKKLGSREGFQWIYDDSHRYIKPISDSGISKRMGYFGMGNLIKWIFNLSGGKLKLSWTWIFGGSKGEKNNVR